MNLPEDSNTIDALKGTFSIDKETTGYNVLFRINLEVETDGLGEYQFVIDDTLPSFEYFMKLLKFIELRER